jgi:trans-aconitate methyltransferase
MSTTREGINAEAIEAWDGPLFERFVQFRQVLTDGLGAHGDVALAAAAAQPGERVLDIGCGFGDSTRDLAASVGENGTVLGIDAAPRFIEEARASFPHVRFEVADVQATKFEERFDLAFSRFGTMFFSSPVVALRNVREALVPGGRLAMVVWRQKIDNDWMYRAQQIVEQIVERPEEYDEPTCGPGPFSMAGADTTSDILLHAGYTDVALRRCDKPIMIGANVDDAMELVMALGPAGEILRLAGDRAKDRHDEVREALRAGLGEYVTPDGLWARASTWVVTATAP